LRKQAIEKLLRSNGKEEEEEQAVSASQKDDDNKKLTTLTTFDVNAGIINILNHNTTHTNNDNSEPTRSVRKGIKKKNTDS